MTLSADNDIGFSESKAVDPVEAGTESDDATADASESSDVTAAEVESLAQLLDETIELIAKMSAEITALTEDWRAETNADAKTNIFEQMRIHQNDLDALCEKITALR